MKKKTTQILQKQAIEGSEAHLTIISLPRKKKKNESVKSFVKILFAVQSKLDDAPNSSASLQRADVAICW